MKRLNKSDDIPGEQDLYFPGGNQTEHGLESTTRSLIDKSEANGAV